MFVREEKQQGFAFISALLLLILISALAVTLVYQTMTETRIGGSDQQNNIAMYAAESGLEKMSADLGQLYSVRLAPSKTDITGLGNFAPNLPNVTFDEYTLVPNQDASGKLLPVTRTISAGPDAGLMGEILPVTLNVTARMSGSNAQVRLTRWAGGIASADAHGSIRSHRRLAIGNGYGLLACLIVRRRVLACVLLPAAAGYESREDFAWPRNMMP